MNKNFHVTLLRTTDTLANSGDPDEMPQKAAFHQGVDCLLRQKRSSEKEF